MQQVTLIVVSTILAVTLIGFTFGYKRARLDFKSVLWRWLGALSGISAATFSLAATYDSVWWLLPGGLYFFLFFQAISGVQRTVRAEQRASWDELQAALSASLPKPKIVDYSEFVVQPGARTLTHCRRDGGVCQEFIDHDIMVLSELIAMADQHVCVPARTAALRSVA